MHPLLPLLEQIEQQGPLAASLLNQQAAQLPAFSQAWLIQAVSSESTATELAYALYWAWQHQLPELAQLGWIWQQFVPYVWQQQLPESQQQFQQLLTQAGLSSRYPAELVSLWCALSAVSAGDAVCEAQPVQQQQLPLPHQLAAAVLQEARRLLHQTEVYSPQQVQVVDQIRNNQQCPTGTPCQNIVFASIERYMAQRSGYPLSHAEPLMLYRYGPGQEYKWHCDFIPDQHPASQTELSYFGQRFATAILYFNQEFTGGETAFKVWQQEVKGQLGTLIYFNNLLPDGRPNPASIHCGRPVLTGEKWIGTLWFREKALWTRAPLL